MTGNVKRFVGKLPFESKNVRDLEKVNEPYVLVTYTIGFGDVPTEVIGFLERNDNYTYMRGVASSGNRNWFDNFAKSADKIADKYGVPILLKFELSGTKRDIEEFIMRVQQLTQR